MSRNPPVQSKHTSFEDPFAVHPWRNFLHLLCEEIDDETFASLIFLSKDKLGDQYAAIEKKGDCRQFFNTLEERHGDEFMASYLEHLLDGLYHDIENWKFSDQLIKYKEEKREYLEKCQGLGLDQFFIGRQETLAELIHILQPDASEYKGVILCGLGGMGKTSLAKEVCCRLLEKFHWNIIVVNQREKTELWELMADLISQLSTDDICTETSEQNLNLQLQQILEQELHPKITRTLIFMDNVDGHCDSPEKLDKYCRLMTNILSNIGSKTRILVTVRRKLGNVNGSLQRTKNKRFRDQMIELELTSLSSNDTQNILRKVSGLSEKDLPDEVCKEINSLCGGSPLAIRTVSGLMKDRCPVQDVVNCLKCDANMVVGQEVEKCLQKSLDVLDKEMQAKLARLSLFQSAQFDLAAAIAVGMGDDDEVLFGGTKARMHEPEKKMKKEILEGMMNVHLSTLKSRHLLEVDCLSKKLNNSNKKLYSLHPLVWKFLCLVCEKSEELKEQKERAKNRFLKYFCSKIDECGKKQDVKPINASLIIRDNMVHIQQFFKLIIDDPIPLRELQTVKDERKQKFKSALMNKHIWKIADIVVSPTKKKLFSRKQADLAEKEKLLYDFIYWKCMEAENLLQQDRGEQAEQLVDDLSKQLGVVFSGTSLQSHQMADFCLSSGWSIEEEEKILMYIAYNTIQGRIKKHRQMFERSLEYLTNAEKLFRGMKGNRKDSFKSDLAGLVNLIGCVYFQMKNYTKSAEKHEEALRKIECLTESRWHEDFSEYLTNIGSCYHQKGLDLEKSETFKRDKLFQDALKKYNQSLRNDKFMKRDMLHCHAVTLRNRAEIYYAKQELEAAVADGKVVLRILEKVCAAPDIKLTLALERLALYYFKFGKQLKKDHDHAKAMENFNQSMTMFDRVVTQIQNGGLPMEHNEYRTYRHIKENHMKVMRELKYNPRLVQTRTVKYQDFENGKYNKRIAENRNFDLDFDPAEFLRKAQAEGETFVLDSCSDNSDDDSESSQSESSSSSKTGSMRSSSSGNSPRVNEDLDTIIAMRRRDSGIEDTVDDSQDDSQGEAGENCQDHPLQLMDVDKKTFRDRGNQKSDGGSEDIGDEMEYRVNVRDSGFEVDRLSRLSDISDSGSHSEHSSNLVERRFKRPLVRQSHFTDSDIHTDSHGITEVVPDPGVPDGSLQSQQRCSQASQRHSSTNLYVVDSYVPGISYPDRSSSSCTYDSGLGTSTSSQQLRVSWRNSRSDEGSGGSGSQKRQESWKSAGSQDSVTSQLRQKLTLNPQSLEEDVFEDMVDEKEEPARKKSKTGYEVKND